MEELNKKNGTTIRAGLEERKKGRKEAEWMENKLKMNKKWVDLGENGREMEVIIVLGSVILYQDRPNFTHLQVVVLAESISI